MKELLLTLNRRVCPGDYIEYGGWVLKVTSCQENNSAYVVKADLVCSTIKIDSEVINFIWLW